MRRTSLIAVSLLVAFASTEVRAQATPDGLRQTPAPRAAKASQKPKAAPKRDVASRTKQSPATRPAATIPDTLPRITDKTPSAAPARPSIGRIPFETGTLGFTTDTQYKTMEFNDGRRTPGFENIQRNDPAYLGFSLSVPTDKQNLFPLPFLSRPD